MKAEQIIKSVIEKEFKGEIKNPQMLVIEIRDKYNYLFKKYHIQLPNEDTEEFNQLYACITGAIEEIISNNTYMHKGLDTQEHNNTLIDFSFFALTLKAYLNKAYPEFENDIEMINSRGKQAAEEFTKLRETCNQMQAEEIAVAHMCEFSEPSVFSWAMSYISEKYDVSEDAIVKIAKYVTVNNREQIQGLIDAYIEDPTEDKQEKLKASISLQVDNIIKR